MKTFEKYIDFILNSIMSDIEVYYNWWMFLIFTAIFYTFFLVLKYTIITLPLWLPVRLALNIFIKDESSK